MTRILSADILIADVIIPLAGNPALSALVERYQLQPGGKATLDDEQFKDLSSAIEGHAFTVTPGGSSANMLTTLAMILGKDVEIRFYGIVGEGAHRELIQSSLDNAGIIVLPGQSHFHHVSLQGAVSFVFVSPDGQCTIGTHPGNARDILKPAMIPSHTVKHSDIVLAQGSLWHKLHQEFADRLYHLCLQFGTQLWLTLPTQADLDSEEAERFTAMIPDANLVLGNEGELTRIYNASLESALKQLQRALRHNARALKNPTRNPIGFITLGKRGAALVSAERIDMIAPVSIRPDEIVNTLGAGDTSYAGFAAGYLKNLPDMESARIAMILAAEKLRITGPRLSNPFDTLKKAVPELAGALV